MHRRLRIAALLAVVVLVTAACGKKGGGTTGGGDGGEGSDFRVGVALDVGGLGDKSFNDAAKRGLDSAIEEGLVSEENTEFIEANATGSNRDQNIVTLADQGYDLIIGVGFAFSEGIAEIAADYPDQDFAIVDGYATTIATDATNITDLAFKEHEGSFLMGAAAAMATEAGTIGFLGGQRGPLIAKFEAGYAAGAKHITPDVEVLVEYIGDDTTAFNDPTKGEALSAKMYDAGADVIYHAAGASGAGLFKAAVEKDGIAIGVDSDQYLTASPEQQPHILSSMLKRVDTAVHDVIADAVGGSFSPGFKVFGMAEEGVDYGTGDEALLTGEITAKLDELKGEIIAGTITVPEEPEA